MKKSYTGYHLIQEYKNLRSLIKFYQSQLQDCDARLFEIRQGISEKTLFQPFVPSIEVISDQLLAKQKCYSSTLSELEKNLEELKSRSDFNIVYVNDIVASEETINIQILGKLNLHSDYGTEYDTFCNIL